MALISLNFSINRRESAHSKKTRIETRRRLSVQWSCNSVKAPIPRKQGLKLQHSPRQRYVQFRESAHSKKTRIETFRWGQRKYSENVVKAPIPRKQGLKLCVGEGEEWILQVKAPIPRKQGLKPFLDIFATRLSSCESAHSKKTRIETLRWWRRRMDIASESAHSKKTRIETPTNFARKIWHYKVKAPIPRKQGLKHRNCSDWIHENTSESAHSKKTRIETKMYYCHCQEHFKVKAPIPRKQGLKHFNYLWALLLREWKRPFQENKDWNNSISKPICWLKSESAHSKKTRIETYAKINNLFCGPRWKRPFQENKDWNSEGK